MKLKIANGTYVGDFIPNKDVVWSDPDTDYHVFTMFLQFSLSLEKCTPETG